MNWRTLLTFIHDLTAVGITWLLAYWLRFNFEIPGEFLGFALTALAWVMPLFAVIFVKFGLYRGIWRYASLGDLRRILLAVGLGALITASVINMGHIYGVPRSTLLLHPILLVMLMGGSRFLYRAWKDGHLFAVNNCEGRPVLILGAGAAAATLLTDLARSQEWRAVGLLDDDPGIQGRRLNDVPILGALADVTHWAEEMDVRHAIIAMPSAIAAKRRRAAELAAEAGLSVFTVPSFDDLLSGRVSISQIRKVELEDLLGRDQVQLDEAGLHGLLTDKVVLVTGAGGSIGSELCRQIARYSPRLLIFFDSSEFAMYRIEQEFAKQFPRISVACLVGDVRDEIRLDEVFGAYRPAIVFHAAAYKHVPLMENENAWQALNNNVLGTWRVARAAMKHAVSRFVLISTDKAVNPTNVMGASKRLAEMVCQALSRNRQGATCFVMVRFGNVLGSSGSVIPKFREQIVGGGPVTVTHPEIVRYFMLIPEAAQLVLQAGLMGQGGEIFVLDMGEPIRIVDLARDMIRLSGFAEEDIRIEFTGLRPGEKLYEELLADGETTQPTPHPKLRVARADLLGDDVWLAELHEWLLQPALDVASVKAGLAARIPEYQPTPPAV